MSQYGDKVKYVCQKCGKTTYYKGESKDDRTCNEDGCNGKMVVA